MTLPFLPEIPKIDPEKGPNLLAGAASPLWLVFGGAAMAGATWWWWSARWKEAVNLEALLAPTLTKAVPEPVALIAPQPEPEAVVAAPPELVAEPVIDPVSEAPVLAPLVPEVPEPVATAAIAAAETAETIVQDALDAVEHVTVETQETAKAVVEPVVEQTVEIAKTAADDLTVVVGIGPKLAASLAELGVTRFEQIAAWGQDELADFDVKLNLKGRAERDAWVAQAKRLANP